MIDKGNIIGEELRCKITGHICGTDTRPVGCPCLCENCQKWLENHQQNLPPEINKLVDKHFWELS